MSGPYEEILCDPFPVNCADVRNWETWLTQTEDSFESKLKVINILCPIHTKA